VDEPAESALAIEHRRAGAALPNRARRKDTNRAWRNFGPSKKPPVVVDHTTPAPHLVDVVVKAVCRNRDHLNDLSACDFSFAEWDRRARGVVGELQDRVVG